MTIQEVKEQIAEMVVTDQQVRKSSPTDKEKLALVTKENIIMITAIIDEFGVIDLRRFGEDTAKGASLIIQHSPTELQRRYLQLMEEFNQADIYMRGYVYLKDRLLVADGKPQLYGTQLKILNGDRDNLAFNPIEDIENLDARRAKAGLEPFEEYIKLIEQKTGKRPSVLESA